ncbi:TMEM175 family protein [Nocardioides sp. CN2-186]|uniref:TMEM175 family protein n=1 Tax=Nocardioides tweenelious TaxID=3156607 RepID=UPI0032B3C109
MVTSERVERARDLDRFLTFIDAIVAIAITLLVLPLVEITADIDQYASVDALLRDNEAELGAFVLSFVVLSRFWFVQHGTMRHVVSYHRGLASVLMIWTMTIVFLPFPTAVVAEASDNPTTKVLYIATMIATTLSLTVVEWLVRRFPDLTDGHADVDPLKGLVNAAALVLALVITLAVPATSYFPLLLLIAADPVVDRIRRLR